MSRNLAIVLGLIGAAALGAVGAAVVAVAAILGGGAEPSLVPVDSDAGELRARMDDLVQEVSRLREEVETLRLAPPMRELTPAAVPAPVAPEEEAAAPAELPESFRDSVEAVVEEKQLEVQERMGRRFSKMAEQREKATLDKLAENNGLTAYQRSEMEAILTKRREVIGGFFRSMFGSGEGEVDMASAREKMQEVREETNTQIQELLTPEQYDAYEAEQSQRGWMGGGMRGGPGSGGGGGGGGNPGGGGR